MECLADGSIKERYSHSLHRIDIYLPFMYLFFFFNSFGLPAPLEYTTLLAPMFYVWLCTKKQKWIVAPFLLCTLPFIIVHLIQGINLKTYLVSYFYIMAIYLVAYAYCVAVLKHKRLGKIFEHIIIINFILACLSLLLLNSQYSGLLWWNVKVGNTLGAVKRLKLFTYEASYYSTLLAPFFVYSYFKATLYTSKKNIILLIFTVIPMAMSFSFGIISSITISLFIVNLFYAKKIYNNNKTYVRIFLPLVFILIVMVIVMTPFYDRLSDVLEGRDMSGTGRTYFSTLIAFEIARQKSIWFGVGFGQTKSYYDVMVSFMQLNFSQSWMNEYLYNTIADTFAATGILGIAMKLLAEIYLFFKTRVYENYFSITLFICIFIYQFTGSYLTNIAEYVVWILAFTRVFPEFKTSGVKKPIPRVQVTLPTTIAETT